MQSLKRKLLLRHSMNVVHCRFWRSYNCSVKTFKHHCCLQKQRDLVEKTKQWYIMTCHGVLQNIYSIKEQICTLALRQMEWMKLSQLGYGGRVVSMEGKINTCVFFQLIQHCKKALAFPPVFIYLPTTQIILAFKSVLAQNWFSEVVGLDFWTVSEQKNFQDTKLRHI